MAHARCDLQEDVQVATCMKERGVFLTINQLLVYCYGACGDHSELEHVSWSDARVTSLWDAWALPVLLPDAWWG